MKTAGTVLLIICICILLFALHFIFSKSVIWFILGIGGVIAYVIWLIKKSGLY